MNKIAIVTGASRGIGKATAKKFIDTGWMTINLSRTNSNLPKIVNLNCDFIANGFQSYLSSTLHPLLEKADQIALVHNASAHFSGKIYEINDKGLENSWQINILAPIAINQIVLPYMKEGSSIIYIGSTLSEIAVPNALPYVLTKHAQLGLMRSTSQDVSHQGIHSCCICPGFTDTEMLNTHLRSGGRSIEEILKHISFKRLIEPSEIAELIYTAATQPVMNGAVLHANLGFTNN